MMLRGLAAAGLLAALQWAGVTPSVAADLYAPYGQPRAEEPDDDDSRYGEAYRLPPPPPPPPPYAGPRYGGPRYVEPPHREPYPPPRYAERHDGPPQVHSDDDDDDDEPRAAGPRYYDLRGRYAGRECLPRRELRRALREQGWGGFEPVELRGDIAVIHASRPSGRLFELKVDRCSGRIVDARPVTGEPDRYAWRRRPYPTY